MLERWDWKDEDHGAGGVVSWCVVVDMVARGVRRCGDEGGRVRRRDVRRWRGAIFATGIGMIGEELIVVERDVVRISTGCIR